MPDPVTELTTHPTFLKRAVFIDHCAQPSGAQLSLLHMSKELGASARVLLLENGPVAIRLADQGTACVVFEVNKEFKGSLIGTAWTRIGTAVRVAMSLRPVILRELEKASTDILVANSLRSALLASFALLPRRVRLVVMVRDGLTEPYLGSFEAIAVKFILRASTRFAVANSRWTAQWVPSSVPTKVVHPFVSTAFFDTPRSTRVWEGRPVRILLLGRVAPWKGQLEAIRAIRNCANPSWTLSVAGTALFGEESYLSKVKRECSDVRIGFLGHVDDVVSLIDDHDIVVHSSLVPEPFGQVVLQSMARGRIVVAARAGGPAEIITDNVDGLLYDMGSGEGLRETIDRLMIWSNEHHDIASAAARTAEQTFHPTLAASSLRSLLEGL